MKKFSNAEVLRPEVAPFTQVFRGEQKSEFWLLRIGPASKNDYLFKMHAPFEHAWNSKIFLLRKDVGPDFAVWHMRHGSSDRLVVFGMKKSGGGSAFEARLEGFKEPIRAQLDEVLSRKIAPSHFLDAYLESLNPSVAVAVKKVS